MKETYRTQPELLICECSSAEHQIIINQIDGEVYCTIHLTKLSFWRRLKHGIKYIFGYKCRYGAFEEFIFSPEHATKILELSKTLSTHKSQRNSYE